jgi:hypothetical protein
MLASAAQLRSEGMGGRLDADTGYRWPRAAAPRLALGRGESELLHHTHLIPLLPAFNNLSGGNAVQN